MKKFNFKKNKNNEFQEQVQNENCNISKDKIIGVNNDLQIKDSNEGCLSLSSEDREEKKRSKSSSVLTLIVSGMLVMGVAMYGSCYYTANKDQVLSWFNQDKFQKIDHQKEKPPIDTHYPIHDDSVDDNMTNTDKQIPQENEYDTSKPDDIFEEIEDVKDNFVGRKDYVYSKDNVELAKKYKLYKVNKSNPFSEIYTQEGYDYEKSTILPNENITNE
ncbi:hypothetical protein [Alkaliphilus sp. B6464]|uniref:hypothetical protein n=1 Tax=Alkaliphilus sp. B6464 TaxID=2731219 RepID=UPI001BACA6D5|nr:hypothetical protein [Alkaliphilus sp. B6464]QUH22137.1 hypothetical protein HYG84_19715 [Alkaliphilus sp. B6464]